jgi:hypothetical protein
MKKTCWCCNGRGFIMVNCSLCIQGTEHRQCLPPSEPKKFTCHACDKKITGQEIKK